MGKTFAVALDADRFAQVFSRAQDDRRPGRSRLCKSCGDWHSMDQAWPHNCRPPKPPRSHLASPRIAPKFEPFKPSVFAETVISDPKSRRDYMERNDLAEYDAGVKQDQETDRQWEEGFVQDFKKSAQMDPLAIEPVDVIGQTDLSDAAEIDTSGIEVFK